VQKKDKEILDDDIVFAPDVIPPERRRRRRTCFILDTADRALALFGEPARRVYEDTVKLWEILGHSEQEDRIRQIYYQEYVSKAHAMWRALDAEIPGPRVFTGRETPPYVPDTKILTLKSLAWLEKHTPGVVGIVAREAVKHYDLVRTNRHLLDPEDRSRADTQLERWSYTVMIVKGSSGWVS